MPSLSFLAKTQNPSVYDPHFKEFTGPSLADFMDKVRDEMVLCAISPQKYLSRMEKLRPDCFSLHLENLY